MGANRLNRWLTLGANFGVLIGIVFLAVEIRQNSNLARMQFLDDLDETLQQTELAMFADRAADVWEKSVTDPGSLSLSELRIFDAYLTNQLSNSLRVFNLEQDGLLEAGFTKDYMQENLPYYFDSKLAKAWWQLEGSEWNPKFVRLADPIIREIGDNETAEKLLDMQRQASSNEKGIE